MAKPWSLADLPAKYQDQAKAQMPDRVGIPESFKRKKGRPEGEFQDAVIAYAESRGWLCYHPYRSDKSTPGFPDLVMLRGHRQVIAELKHGDNRVTPEQDAWLRAFVDAGAQVHEWRERDWGEIERVLR